MVSSARLCLVECRGQTCPSIWSVSGQELLRPLSWHLRSTSPGSSVFWQMLLLARKMDFAVGRGDCRESAVAAGSEQDFRVLGT